MSRADVNGVIVAGMHRSGTSLMTRLLVDGGWHPGEHVLASETEQYLEDSSFVAIHRDWLRRSLPDGDGHRDWGVSSGGPLDPSRLGNATSTVQQFCAGRSAARERWVAKDPRASLFLDQWAQQPGLRFVLVYRSVWDVVDSALRLAHAPFCADPSVVRRAWLLHNERVVDFVRRQRARCTLVAAETMATDLRSVWSALDAAVGVHGIADPGVVDRSRLRTRDRNHPIAGLTGLLHRECADLLEALDDLADVPRPGPSAEAGPVWRRTVTGGSLPEATGVQVVIPCRDDGAFIDEAIASVEHACEAPTEVTIVDDGSTVPETVRVLDLLRDAGYQVLRTPGLGLAAARNVGCAASRTLAVLPLDADNRVRPALLAGLRSIESGESDVVHGAWEEFGMRNRVVRPPDASFDSLLPFNNIDACALVRRSVLEGGGGDGSPVGYDERLPYMEDWDLWLRALAEGARFRRLEEVTFQYLVRPGSLNSTLWADDAVRDAAVQRVLGRHPLRMGSHGVATVQRLMAAMHRIDQLELEVVSMTPVGSATSPGATAAAADGPASELASELAAELAAIRSRRSYRAIEAATRALARRPRLRSWFLRLSGRR